MVTRKTTLTHGDGRKEVSEEVIEDGKKSVKKYVLGPGESNGNKEKLKY